MHVLILAGGTGTRLWPLSREKSPKQFQRLLGKETLFQMALRRAKRVAKMEDIYVATNELFVKEVRKQAPGIPVRNIIAEPAFRDTATCLGYAAAILQSRSPGAVFAVLYADHLIREEDELTRKLRAAEKVASEGKFCIIEVKSLYPATQLGWVRTGKKMTEVKGEEVYAFEKFCEKPDHEKAQEFHRSSEYLWNTGLYVWRADTLLEKFHEHLPDTYARLMRMTASKFAKKVVDQEYAACQKISIDFGVMEKVKKNEVAILPANLGWSDVGTWDSLKDELTEEGANHVEALWEGEETENCYIRADDKKKLIVTVGVKDLVIVDTGDTLMICPRNGSSKVKKVVERLKGGRFA